MGGPMLPWDIPHVPFVYVQFCLDWIADHTSCTVIGFLGFGIPDSTKRKLTFFEHLALWGAQVGSLKCSDSEDEVDDCDRIPWVSLTPEQVEQFEENGLHRPGKLAVI
ncbi:hypothetical protein B0H15DRAFT_804145 [Mycena belliarum]|uniref:Uncharacterized protein n=1 Tax=Mycena belliarum TaxID=1033014 RepID=A0AAD6TUH4_9AGAR|nr:hypothetical protein B0H15DRAFT_804145 [Mycena belliae]